MKQQERSEYRVYQVWRMDDNGSEFLVEAFEDRNCADTKMSELAASGHKQVYWIKEADIS